MSVADQARFPGSVLCQFLDSRMPQRAVVADDWAGRVAAAPWAPGLAVRGSKPPEGRTSR